jgi:zinc/manganese transport system substrate-binding protein
VAGADLVVENGLGYDAWMDHLLGSAGSGNRVVLTVGTMAGGRLGQNPHVWYDVALIDRLTGIIARDLIARDSGSRSYIQGRLTAFRASLRPVYARIAAIRARYRGERVAQTEPVFAFMLRSLHISAQEGAFQHAIEAGIDPSPADITAVQRAITDRQVSALVYNRQTVAPITVHLSQLAHGHDVPVVGVTETEPAHTTYARWMSSELTALQQALGRGPRT